MSLVLRGGGSQVGNETDRGVVWPATTSPGQKKGIYKEERNASYQMYTDTKVYEGDWYINVDVKHDESHYENHWLDMWPKSSRGSPRCAVLSCWGTPN